MKTAPVVAAALLVVIPPVTLPAQEPPIPPVDQGGGEFVIPHVPHLTEDQRRDIRERIARSIASLGAQGRIPTALTPGVTLTWPLARWNGLQTFDYHGISNFVDLDPGYPGLLLDYQCGTRSYDLDNGYNHQGIDYFTWPFSWLLMDNEEVAVIAAAPGTILDKDDGQPDRNCGFGAGNWNAVYVRHDDGSIAWYGHMKLNSLTTKGAGDRVERGEFLGIVGSSGNSTGPHLHLELYDAAGTLTEPHTGACNSITSWWQQQRPYFDSAINRITTGFAPPDFPACPVTESPNAATDFNAGDIIYFTNYYHDQLAGQISLYRIDRPDGSLWTSWSHSMGVAHYAASWWWWSFNFAGAPAGIWKYEVMYQSRTYERFFTIGGPFPVGRVPATSVEGVPLSVTQTAGDDLTLTWGASCLGTETDYAIYEGTLGDWSSHVAKQCSTGGATTATITPAAESRYYLVVPRNQGFEGSYGRDASGAERPQAEIACLQQVIDTTACGG